ncbi:alpha/beta hydrolase [Streptomyces sp. NPDC006288]|uniref:alpha/beta hydrolase n=1 Tax=Streptomyces sp. NPDC006288 TaxID=3156743 RepID=UPI0033AE24E6
MLLTAEEEGHGTYPQNRCVTETVNKYLRAGCTPAPGRCAGAAWPEARYGSAGRP